MNDKISEILKMIDHTLLKQDAIADDVKKVCAEAKQYGFYSVITHPYYIGEVKKQLLGTGVVCGTVVGFPFGCELSGVKAFQTEAAIRQGAEEIDMVMSISAFKNKDYGYVLNDIKQVVKEAGQRPVKVILETTFLNSAEIKDACAIAIDAGTAFVKTSTGFFGGGATVEAVGIMSAFCNGKIGVKAAGGIRTAEDAIAMVKAGATRIGTSGGVLIAKGLENTETY